MATALQVEIVTPERAVFSGTANEIVLPAWEGELGVLPDHDALLSLLRAGVCTVSTGGATRRWVIGRGFADIGGERVTLLTDQAVPVEEIDRPGAEAMLAAALTEIDAQPPGTEAQKQAVARAEWARALLGA